jgi:hypothetical protein
LRAQGMGTGHCCSTVSVPRCAFRASPRWVWPPSTSSIIQITHTDHVFPLLHPLPPHSPMFTLTPALCPRAAPLPPPCYLFSAPLHTPFTPPGGPRVVPVHHKVRNIRLEIGALKRPCGTMTVYRTLQLNPYLIYNDCEPHTTTQSVLDLLTLNLNLSSPVFPSSRLRLPVFPSPVSSAFRLRLSSSQVVQPRCGGRPPRVRPHPTRDV